MATSSKTGLLTHLGLALWVAAFAMPTDCVAQRTYEFVGEGNFFPQDFLNGEVLATLTLNELPVTADSITIDFGSDFLSIGGRETLSRAAGDSRTLSEVAPGVLGCTECSGNDFLEYRFTDSFNDIDGPVFFIVAATFNQSGAGTLLIDSFGTTEDATGIWTLAVPEPTSITLCLIAGGLGLRRPRVARKSAADCLASK